MSLKKTKKTVPIGIKTNKVFGRLRSDTDKDFPPSFESADNFMRKRAEEKRDEWTTSDNLLFEVTSENDEIYSPEIITADASVIDISDSMSNLNIIYKKCVYCGIKCKKLYDSLCEKHRNITLSDLYSNEFEASMIK